MLKSLKISSFSSIMLFIYVSMMFPIAMIFFKNEISYILDWNIITISSCNFSFMVIFDYVSISFSLLVCLISASVMMFSSSYMSHEVFLARFIILVMLFVASMNLLIFIPSLPALLLGWDGLGIVSFALVIYYQNMKSLAAGMFTILANRIGDVMILISIGVLVIQGHWLITLIWDFQLAFLLMTTMTIGAMTKSAQIPFSSWLPAAMAAPTPVSALVHSSTLVTAGVFLVIRFYPFLSSVSYFNQALLFISVITLLMAGMAANYETDLKKVIALSTLSQLGVMMMSLGLGYPLLALFHLYTHALFKALLFLCAGTVIHNSSNSQDIRSMGMYFYQGPLTIMCMNIANLSLCGAPFLSGFFSKDLILEQSLFNPTNFLILLMAMFATALTASYSTRLAMCALWGASKTGSFHSKTDKDYLINFPTTLLAVCAVAAGSFMQSCQPSFTSSLIMLPSLHKYMTMAVIITGVMSMLVMWSDPYFHYFSDMLTDLSISSKHKAFLTMMWFITPLSTQPLTNISMNSGTNMIKAVDQGWMEIAGGQGIYYSVNKVSLINSQFQMMLSKDMMFVILSILSLMLVLSM